MTPKKKSKQQQQLNVDQFKLLKKPMDHQKPTPLLYQVSGPFHDLLTARLLLYIGVSRGTFAKFRPETDAFIEISNLTQSLPHNQTPTSKFQVPSTRVK
jgi:hypothetical protein